MQDFVITPYIVPYNTSVYAQYTIQVNNRDEVIDRLKTQDIPTAVHYPIPLNQQPAFAVINQSIKVSFPVAERVAEQVMSLPMHPYLTEPERRKICQVLIANLGLESKDLALAKVSKAEANDDIP